MSSDVVRSICGFSRQVWPWHEGMYRSRIVVETVLDIPTVHMRRSNDQEYIIHLFSCPLIATACSSAVRLFLGRDEVFIAGAKMYVVQHLRDRAPARCEVRLELAEQTGWDAFYVAQKSINGKETHWKNIYDAVARNETSG